MILCSALAFVMINNSSNDLSIDLLFLLAKHIYDNMAVLVERKSLLSTVISLKHITYNNFIC